MQHRVLTALVFAYVYLGSPLMVHAQTADPAVKKSESGICHDKNSPSFEKTQKFTPFKSLDECVKSGGTLPKK